MLTLGIETSGKTASAALFEDRTMLSQTTLYTSKTHSQVILPMVKKLMEDCSKKTDELDLIAVGAGPGSYTGIRIGIAAVKAMSFALKIPCCAVSSLEGIAFAAAVRDGYICVVMKARQELVYTALFKSDGYAVSRATEDEIIESDILRERLSELSEPITLCGDGAEEFSEKYGKELSELTLAPPHLMLQSGVGICLAAMTHEPCDPEDIQASYLQLVKAQKDLIEAKKAEVNDG